MKIKKMFKIVLVASFVAAMCFDHVSALDFASRMKALRQRMTEEGNVDNSVETPDETTSKSDEPAENKALNDAETSNGSTKVAPKIVEPSKKSVKTPKKKIKKSKKLSVPKRLPLNPGWKQEADNTHGYRIQFPKNWQTSFLTDGPDRIKTGLSPDQNLSVRVRSFDCGPGATLELVKMAFEQRVLGGGTILHTENGRLCGVPSNLSIYSGQFNNLNVNIVSVILLRNNRGYIVWTMVPSQLFASRSAEADAVLATFEFIN